MNMFQNGCVSSNIRLCPQSAPLKMKTRSSTKTMKCQTGNGILSILESIVHGEIYGLVSLHFKFRDALSLASTSRAMAQEVDTNTASQVRPCFVEMP